MSAIVGAAIVSGLLAVLIAFGAQLWRRPLYWIWLLPVAVGIGFRMDILRKEWAWDSFVHDVPWGIAAGLAVWTGLSRAGILRVRSWGAVVVASALVGDLCVATGLALAEPDPARRARLVVAASGASLVGWTSGAATLLLGPASWEIRALGLALAAVGLVGAGGASREAVPVVAAPEKKELGFALCGALAAGVAAWLLAAGGALEFVADGLEQLPLVVPHEKGSTVLLAALAGGAVGEEGVMAFFGREVLARGNGLSGPWAADMIRLGLSVGGGLPLLVASGSRLATGVPLWLVQVIVVMTWAWLRG